MCDFIPLIFTCGCDRQLSQEGGDAHICPRYVMQSMAAPEIVSLTFSLSLVAITAQSSRPRSGTASPCESRWQPKFPEPILTHLSLAPTAALCRWSPSEPSTCITVPLAVRQRPPAVLYFSPKPLLSAEPGIRPSSQNGTPRQAVRLHRWRLKQAGSTDQVNREVTAAEGITRDTASSSRWVIVSLNGSCDSRSG